MAFEPTHEQSLAINRKGNILVAAAAGSGKTKVLVERVIGILKDEERNIQADELLIVTFTKAAAAEMRSRIEKRIDEECRQNPSSAYLLCQKHLLSSAKICTIDSFCMDLVRENFDKLSISPDFKIGDNTSLNQTNQRVVYKILNRYIAENNQTFLNLVDLVGGEYNEQNLANLLLGFYDFSRQLPFPQKWYDEVLEQYTDGVFDNKNVWYNYAFDFAKETLTQFQTVIANIVDSISAVSEPANIYLPEIQAWACQIDDLIDTAQKRDWDEFYTKLNSFKSTSLTAAKNSLGDYIEVKTLKAAYKNFNSKILNDIKKLFYANSTYINEQFKHIYPCVVMFVDILRELDSEIFNEYNLQNTFTFHNIEHLALNLLCKENEDGKIIVSENGKELLHQYKEVMVDEYQDTNNLQDYLFYVLSNFEEKLFVVGDVKQSIYAFRGANPENFLLKKQRYIPIDEADETMAQKIILANNFRTKGEVCDFINYFFEKFMTYETGNINYDGEERLIPTLKYPDVNLPAVDYSILNCKGNKDSNWEIEAKKIANYIYETMSSGEIIKDDESETGLRKAKFGDFTILLRATTNAPIIIKVLKEQGIPVDLSLEAFAENREISTVLALLKFIDNPDSDVELLTVLFSPIFSFSTDDLAEIRAKFPDGSIYTALLKAKNDNNSKAIDFIQKLEKYRLFAVSHKLPDLITKLLFETEFLNIISAFPEGEKRKNNLLTLISMAEQYSSNGGKYINQFIDYINNISDSDNKKTPSTNNNSVKIMTMHGSKGLQFPVCILAGTASTFGDQDAKQPYCYNVKYGLGFNYFDESNKNHTSTISRNVILRHIKNTNLQDELRLLYVALTRTQDKLFIISAIDNYEDKIIEYKNKLLMHNCDITKAFFNNSSSYADWLIPALLMHPDGDILREPGDLIKICSTSSKVNIKVEDWDSILPSKPTSNNDDDKTDYSVFVTQIRENTAFSYPYEDILNIRSKTSVSALANKAESDKFAYSQRPAFMSKGNMTATDRGTAMHKVMQYFDFCKFNKIDEEIERLYEWQFIGENEYKSLDKKALEEFFKSEIFERIKKAEKVEREMRFLTEVPATLIDSTLDNRFENEKIIIQGAVDLCIIENDGIVILDFKTDRAEEPSALTEAYGMQLSIYALAAEKIFKMPVKEKLIYSFHLGKTIKL